MSDNEPADVIDSQPSSSHQPNRRSTQNPLKKEDIEKGLKAGNFFVTDESASNRTSNVWKQFGLIRKSTQHSESSPGDVIEGFAACRICKKTYAFHSRMTGTKTLSYHLQRCRTSTGQQPRILESLRAVGAPAVSSAMKQTITTAAMEFTCLDLRSFKAIEGPGMRRLAESLIKLGQMHPRQKIDVAQLLPKANTVKRKILDVSDQTSTKVRDFLPKLIEDGSVAFTTDMWTDDFRKNPYIDLSCYFIDDDYKLVQFTLACKGYPVEERKTGDNIRSALRQIFAEYNLDLDSVSVKNCYFTTDCGSNIKAALTNTRYKRLDCMAHRINTILREAWTTVEQVSEEAKSFRSNCLDLVRYCKQSSIQAKLTKTLKPESKTRWNSFYMTLKSIKKSYSDLDRLLSSSRDSRKITAIDRYLLKGLTGFLKTFKQITDRLEAEKEPTLQRVVLAYYLILDVCTPGDDDHNALLLLKSQITYQLKEKVVLNNIHWIAVFLDPSHKQLLMLDEPQRSTQITKIKQLIQESCRMFSHDAQDSPDPTLTPSTSAGPPQKKPKTDIFSKWSITGASPNTESTVPTVDQQINAYLQIPNVDGTPLLQFWRTHQTPYDLPDLARLAKSVFVIPATSASSERCFSTAGRVLEKRRSALSPHSVDAILRVRGCLRNKLI